VEYYPSIGGGDGVCVQNAKWDATEKLTASLKECEAELRRVRAKTSAAAAASCSAAAAAAAPPRRVDPAALSTAARASVRAAAAALSSTATDAAATAAMEGLMSPRAPPSGKRPGKLQARVMALQEQVRDPVV
jgi:hypothetical protein